MVIFGQEKNQKWLSGEKDQEWHSERVLVDKTSLSSTENK
jgi:hypothetical protein